MIKAILKKILGPKSTSKIREWFPSRVKKESDLRETQRKCAFYSSFIGKGEICFDVGANMGNRIMPFLQIGAKVVAVEPQENCYKYLNRKFGNKIELVRKGLGEKEDIRKFHLSADSTISSFSEDWIKAVKKSRRFKEKNWESVRLVEMTTLDKLVAEYGLPSFIKIDVEGYELEVLKGLTAPVRMISFEFTVPEQPERAIMCIEQIEKYNKQIECNYSIGEDMVWALSQWLTSGEMKDHILADHFMNNCFGDIYVRSK